MAEQQGHAFRHVEAATAPYPDHQVGGEAARRLGTDCDGAAREVRQHAIVNSHGEAGAAQRPHHVAEHRLAG